MTKLAIAILEDGRQSKEIASECGLAEATLSSLIHGKHAPHLRTIWKLCTVLDKTMDELFENQTGQVKH